jgi:hypothetical protein
MGALETTAHNNGFRAVQLTSILPVYGFDLTYILMNSLDFLMPALQVLANRD